MRFEEVVAADTRLSQIMGMVGNGGLSETEALKACVVALVNRLDKIVVRSEMLGEPLSVLKEIKGLAKNG